MSISTSLMVGAATSAVRFGSNSVPIPFSTDAFVYLDAGNTNSYPGTGNTWFDLSGNGLDATLYGSPTHNANGTFTLDGTDDYADLPDGFANSFANGFSIFAIWNFGSAAHYERIIDLGQGAGDDNIIVGRKGTTDTLFYQLYDGSTSGTFVEVANGISNNQIASYAISINGTDGRFYRNGSLIGTQTNYSDIPTNVTRTENFIGRSNWHGAPDAISSGAMGVVIIYRRSLSVNDVETLHNNFAARYGLTAV